MTNKETLIPVPGRLYSVASEAHLCGADQIFDDRLEENQEEINKRIFNILRNIDKFSYEVVDILPEPSEDTLWIFYFVPSEDQQEENIKDEYITIKTGNNTYEWEKIGSTLVDVSDKLDKNFLKNQPKQFKRRHKISIDGETFTDVIGNYLIIDVEPNCYYKIRQNYNNPDEDSHMFAIVTSEENEAGGNIPFAQGEQIVNIRGRFWYYFTTPSDAKYLIMNCTVSSHTTIQKFDSPDFIEFALKHDLDKYATKDELNNKVDKDGNKVLSDQNFSNLDKQKLDSLPSRDQLESTYAKKQDIPDVSNKQDKLVSGQNIKTINNQSLLGEGNIQVGEGGIFVQEQVDWNENNPTSVKYILNKPEFGNFLYTKKDITLLPYYLTDTGFGTDDKSKHACVEVQLGEKYLIKNLSGNEIFYAFATSSEYEKSGEVPIVEGTEISNILEYETKLVTIPEGCTYLLFSGVEYYPRQGTLPARIVPVSELYSFGDDLGIYALKTDRKTGNEVFVITADSNNIVDKTFAEILNAIESGKICILKVIDENDFKLDYYFSYISDDGVSIVFENTNSVYHTANLSLAIIEDDNTQKVYYSSIDLATLDSPSLKGQPTAPDFGGNTSSRIATVSWVNNKINSLDNLFIVNVDSHDYADKTFNEIATAVTSGRPCFLRPYIIDYGLYMLSYFEPGNAIVFSNIQEDGTVRAAVIDDDPQSQDVTVLYRTFELAKLKSPIFKGTPKAPDYGKNTSSQIATINWVNDKFATLPAEINIVNIPNFYDGWMGIISDYAKFENNPIALKFTLSEHVYLYPIVEIRTLDDGLGYIEYRIKVLNAIDNSLYMVIVDGTNGASEIQLYEQLTPNLNDYVRSFNAALSGIPTTPYLLQNAPDDQITNVKYVQDYVADYVAEHGGGGGGTPTGDYVTHTELNTTLTEYCKVYTVIVQKNSGNYVLTQGTLSEIISHYNNGYKIILKEITNGDTNELPLTYISNNKAAFTLADIGNSPNPYVFGFQITNETTVTELNKVLVTQDELFSLTQQIAELTVEVNRLKDNQVTYNYDSVNQILNITDNNG